MITISKSGETEPISDFNDLFIEEEVNGVFALNFNAFNSEINKHGYPLISHESLVEYEGHEYRVKDLISSNYSKKVIAPHIFFDLVGVQKHDTYGGTRTPQQIFNWLYGGTGWSVEIVDNIPAAVLPNFGRGNVIALTRTACKTFGCELEILPGKRLRVHQRLGKDDDFQFRYGYNIKTFEHSVDTTNLRTSIKGFGNGIEAEYISPNRSKFPHAGEADPVYDDRFTIVGNLLDRIKRELIDFPEVSIEISELDLGESKDLGDFVWLIYEPLDIEFQSRIVARKVYPKATHKNTVTLGSKKETVSDQLTEQNVKMDENAKQVQSRFEQVNDRITLEVEAVNESISSIEVEQDRISLSVTNLRNDTNAQFIVMSDRIESKVDGLDFNGENIMSMIEQTPSYITLSAQKINFDGEIFGNSNARFEGQVRAERIIGNEISGVTLRTSNANKYIHMENQEIVLWEGGFDKMRIGFRNEYGDPTQVPYIILGYGNHLGRDQMVIEKDGGYFHMVYSTRDFESSIKMNYTGSMAVRSDGILYLEARNTINADSTINAPEFNQTSTVKIKDNIQEFEGIATDIVNRTGVYTYYLKKDLEEGIYNNAQIGFIAEAAPDLKTGDAISMYRAIALSWKAIQEKDLEIKQLTERIDILEEII